MRVGSSQNFDIYLAGSTYLDNTVTVCAIDTDYLQLGGLCVPFLQCE